MLCKRLRPVARKEKVVSMQKIGVPECANRTGYAVPKNSEGWMGKNTGGRSDDDFENRNERGGEEGSMDGGR